MANRLVPISHWSFYNYIHCTIYVHIGTSTDEYISFQGNYRVSGTYLVTYEALLEQIIPLDLLRMLLNRGRQELKVMAYDRARLEFCKVYADISKLGE